jgi:uncharacterized protein (DUF4415 family)
MGITRFTSETLPNASEKELGRTAAIKDEDIDCSDIPEFKDLSAFRPWEDRRMYKPVKVAVTCRLDADVLAWLKVNGKGYQSRMNAILRNAMETTG